MSYGEWCHKAVFVVKIVKIIYSFTVIDICLALTTAQAKNTAIALANSWKANLEELKS